MTEKTVGMYIKGEKNRYVFDLAIAYAVGSAVLLLNFVIALNEDTRAFLSQFARVPHIEWLIYFLFGWVAVMLTLAFIRWRRVSRRNAELEGIVSSISPDALTVVDETRRIIMCNHSIERLFGYTIPETVGQNTDLLYFDRRVDKSRPREIYEALERDGFHIGLATGRRKDGSTFPLKIISAEVRGRKAAVLLLRDITERKEAERQRSILGERIHRREKLESMGEMAAGVAHDFNNILSVILMNGDLALPEADAKIRERIDAICQAASQGAEMCALMLACAGKTHTKKRKADLSEIVRQSVRLLKESVGERITVSTQLADGLPAINANSAQMTQVAMNLILNARDAIGGGTGQIRIQTSLRQCTAADLADNRSSAELAPGPYVALDVSDDGCGMDETTLGRLFEPFFTTKENGKGLGLASVLGIIGAHDAAIKVESEKGKGTVFTVLIPASGTPAATAADTRLNP